MYKRNFLRVGTTRVVLEVSPTKDTNWPSLSRVRLHLWLRVLDRLYFFNLALKFKLAKISTEVYAS